MPPEYRLGYGDVVDVVFLYHNNLSTRDLLVRSDGMITLPYVGDERAAGLSPMELDSVLTYRFAEILREPSLSVILREPAERVVYVLGEVKRPGGYTYKEKITIAQAITEAEGFLTSSKGQNTVVIRREGLDKIVGVEIDVRSILNGEAIQNDIYLKNYDIVWVPKSRVYTVSEFSEAVWKIVAGPLDIVLKGWQIRTLQANYEFFRATRLE